MLFLSWQQLLGIPLALLGAVLLAYGTQYQSRGVKKAGRIQQQKTGEIKPEPPAIGFALFLELLRRPSWVIGTLLLGAAIIAQLGSLVFAPLIVVQPLGAIAIAITAVLNARHMKISLSHRVKVAVGLCVGGVGVFVLLAAGFANEHEITEERLLTVLALVFLAVLGFGAFLLLRRGQVRAGFAIVGSGVLFGFVVTMADVIINRVLHGNFGWLTILSLLLLLLAGGMGVYLVQQAHSRGSPDLVVAGLTVIDPLVAVTVGAVVLGEADNIPLFVGIVIVLAGLVAVLGVWQLSRYHSETPEQNWPSPKRKL